MLGSLRIFAARTSFSPTSTATLTALALLAGSANAADFAMPMKAPPPLLVFSWTGFYIDADIGYARGKDTTTEYLTSTNTFAGFNPTYKISSAVGGLYAGYNYQIGSAVLGTESDIEAANIRGGFIDPVVGGAGTTLLDWQGSLQSRLGFTADKVLFYSTGGLVFADISHTYTNLVTSIAQTTSGLHTGWTAGPGIEVALMPNLFGSKYRYTDYGPYRYGDVVSRLHGPASASI